MAETLGERIKRLRKAKGWKKRDLADVTGFSKRLIVRFERDHEMPNEHEAHVLALAFGVDILEGEQ